MSVSLLLSLSLFSICLSIHSAAGTLPIKTPDLGLSDGEGDLLVTSPGPHCHVSTEVNDMCGWIIFNFIYMCQM